MPVPLTNKGRSSLCVRTLEDGDTGMSKTSFMNFKILESFKSIPTYHTEYSEVILSII